MADSSGGLQYDVNELTIYDFFKYWPSLAMACVALSLYVLGAGIIAWMIERRKAYRFVHCITWVPRMGCRPGHMH